MNTKRRGCLTIREAVFFWGGIKTRRVWADGKGFTGGCLRVAQVVAACCAGEREFYRDKLTICGIGNIFCE